MEKNEMTEKSEMNETIENKAKENVVIDDFDFSLIADFFKRVDKTRPWWRVGDKACYESDSRFQAKDSHRRHGMRQGKPDLRSCR